MLRLTADILGELVHDTYEWRSQSLARDHSVCARKRCPVLFSCHVIADEIQCRSVSIQYHILFCTLPPLAHLFAVLAVLLPTLAVIADTIVSQ